MRNLIRDNWVFAPTEALLAMVEKHWRPGNPLGSCLMDETWACPAYSAWREYATGLLVPLRPSSGKVMSYAVKTAPSDQVWANGYPHNHGYAYHTVCHYLDPGGAKAELWIDAGVPGIPQWHDQPTVIVPEQGLTLCFDASLEHGVRGSPDPHERIALVMQSMPLNAKVGPIDESPSNGREVSPSGEARGVT